MVDCAEDIIGGLELHMKIHVLHLDLSSLDVDALGPGEHDGQLAVFELRHQRYFNMCKLCWQCQEPSAALLERQVIRRHRRNVLANARNIPGVRRWNLYLILLIIKLEVVLHSII